MNLKKTQYFQSISCQNFSHNSWEDSQRSSILHKRNSTEKILSLVSFMLTFCNFLFKTYLNGFYQSQYSIIDVSSLLHHTKLNLMLNKKSTPLSLLRFRFVFVTVVPTSMGAESCNLHANDWWDVLLPHQKRYIPTLPLSRGTPADLALYLPHTSLYGPWRGPLLPDQGKGQGVTPLPWDIE